MAKSVIPANDNDAGADDVLYRQAVRAVRTTGRARISDIQRQLRIGFDCASRLMERMRRAGIFAGPA